MQYQDGHILTYFDKKDTRDLYIVQMLVPVIHYLLFIYSCFLIRY
jgi:hypothetical protein